MISIKRAYEEPQEADGYRVLVDRLWPRGLSKERAKINYWLKEIAPSKELRQWFNHDPEKFDLFKDKYEKELVENKEAYAKLLSIVAEKENITFIYSAKNQLMNNAAVLKAFIEGKK